MASVLRCPAELVEDGEDDDELFEINLDAVGDTPQYCWESGLAATGTALLANCLMPVSDLSGAIPMVSRSCGPLSFPGHVVMIGEPVPVGKFIIQLSCLDSFGVQSKNVK